MTAIVELQQGRVQGTADCRTRFQPELIAAGHVIRKGFDSTLEED